MLYFFINGDGKISQISEEYPSNDAFRSTGHLVGWTNRNDFKSFDRAQEVATQAIQLTGKRYVAVDQGANHYPRYDVVLAPQVGDKVSYAFNGDYYPDGEIVSVSPTLVVKTSTGNTYRRRKLTSSWRRPGGTWSLVQGHISRLNPEF